MSLIHKLFRFMVRLFTGVLRSISEDLYFKVVGDLEMILDKTLEVKTKFGPILFYCNSDIVRNRAGKMFIREPDTIAWIESFEPDEVLWDVGANIGVFTLYAAIASRIIAVESLRASPQPLTQRTS